MTTNSITTLDAPLLPDEHVVGNERTGGILSNTTITVTNKRLVIAKNNSAFRFWANSKEYTTMPYGRISSVSFASNSLGTYLVIGGEAKKRRIKMPKRSAAAFSIILSNQISIKEDMQALFKGVNESVMANSDKERMETRIEDAVKMMEGNAKHFAAILTGGSTIKSEMTVIPKLVRRTKMVKEEIVPVQHENTPVQRSIANGIGFVGVIKDTSQIGMNEYDPYELIKIDSQSRSMFPAIQIPRMATGIIGKIVGKAKDDTVNMMEELKKGMETTKEDTVNMMGELKKGMEATKESTASIIGELKKEMEATRNGTAYMIGELKKGMEAKETASPAVVIDSFRATGYKQLKRRVNTTVIEEVETHAIKEEEKPAQVDYSKFAIFKHRDARIWHHRNVGKNFEKTG